MAEPLVLPKFPALDSAPTREDVEEGIAAFRAEFERSENRSAKAALAHHMALLLERKGDLPAAARDALTATNLAPGFIAPIETLIRVAQESRSAANLDRLLARLASVSEDPENLERARLYRSLLLLDQGQVGDALTEAEQALETSAGSAVAALCLEFVAARAGDETARLRATGARTATAVDSDLRRLLNERWALRLESSGDLAGAEAAWRRALESGPRVETFEQLERLGRKTGDFPLVAEAALGAAELLEGRGALEVGGTAPPVGQVARLRAALAYLEAGRRGEARAQLEILAYGEQAGLLEGALLFALATSSGELAVSRGVLDRLLQAPEEPRDGALGGDRGFLHLLASLLAMQAGDEQTATSHRGEAERLLGRSLTAQALELLRAVRDSEEPTQRLTRAHALFDSLLTEAPPETSPETGAETRSAPTGTEARTPATRATRQQDLASRHRRDLLLVDAATLLTLGDTSGALRALAGGKDAGLPAADAARLELGILRALGDPSAKLRLLAAPPESLPQDIRLTWLLEGLRTSLTLMAPGDAGAAPSPELHPVPASELLDQIGSLLSGLEQVEDPSSQEALDPGGDFDAATPASERIPTAADELLWLQHALRPPGGPTSDYLPKSARGSRRLGSTSKELERALKLATLLTTEPPPEPEVDPDPSASGTHPAAEKDRQVVALLRDHMDPVTLGLGMGLPGVLESEKELGLLKRLEAQLGQGPEGDAIRLRAGLLTLSLALASPHDLERRQLAREEAERTFGQISQGDVLAVLGPWLRRAGSKAGTEAFSPDADSQEPVDQLEAAFSALDRNDVASSSSLALSQLTPPRCGAAQLLRLLLSMGLSPAETEDALASDAFIDDELKAQLSLVSAFLTAGPSEQLEAANELGRHREGLFESLTMLTCARLAGDPDAERRAIDGLARQLDVPEITAWRLTSAGLLGREGLLRPEGASGEADAEPALSHQLLELAQAELEAGRQRTAASVTWELLEHLGRRFSREGFSEDLWRTRISALELLAACIAMTGEDDSSVAASPNGDSSPAGTKGQEVAYCLLQAGYLALAVGDDERALQLFGDLLPQLPDDEALFLGLRVAAARTSDAELEARASMELARRSPHHRAAAALWERAGVLLEDELGRSERAEEAYAAALARLPSSPIAFSRLYAIATEAGDRDRLIELIDTRLPSVDDKKQRIELLWEKARYCRSLGRPAAALSALSELLTLEPQHLQALALGAELHLVDRRLESAADLLRTIALHPQTPEQERREAGLHAADLLEGLHRPKEALALLGELGKRGVPEPDLLERRARTAALAGQWDLAYEGYRKIAEERDVISERLQAARLTLAIVRDHLASADELKEAARLVLRDSPTDEDAVSVVVEQNFNPDERSRLLAPALEECLADLRRNPLDASKMLRLCLLTERGKSEALERLALGMLSLTGSLGDRRKARLEELRAKVRKTPSAPLSPGDLQAVASSGQLGTFAELGHKSQACLREAALPNPAALGITSSMRVDPFSGARSFEECESLCSALGFSTYDLFVGGAMPEAIMVLPGDPAVILLGSEVSLPLSDVERARLGYLVFSHLLGTALFLQMSFSEAESWLSALFRLNTTEVMTGDQDPSVEEKAGLLAQILSREEAEELSELAAQSTHGGMTPAQLVMLARAGAARMATLIHGDPSIIRKLPELVPADEAARNRVLSEVVRFAASETFLALRNKLGLDLP